MLLYIADRLLVPGFHAPDQRQIGESNRSGQTTKRHLSSASRLLLHIDPTYASINSCSSHVAVFLFKESSVRHFVETTSRIRGFIGGYSVVIRTTSSISHWSDCGEEMYHGGCHSNTHCRSQSGCLLTRFNCVALRGPGSFHCVTHSVDNARHTTTCRVVCAILLTCIDDTIICELAVNLFCPKCLVKRKNEVLPVREIIM